MGDSFNAHDILAKLRAKSGANVGEVPASVDPKQRPSNNPPLKQNPSTKVIKGPSALTLTPSQRQDNLNIRIELEKDIKTLQDEVAALKSENKQLRSDKEDVEQQFIEYKVANEKRVTKLRGKMAAMQMGVYSPSNVAGEIDKLTSSGVGGKIYPPPPPQHNTPLSSSHRGHQPHTYLKSTSPISGNIHPGLVYHPSAQSHQQQMEEEESFRDLTFSQLMRRSTHDNPDYQDTLRRSGNKRIAVPQSGHNSATKLPPRSSNQLYNSVNGTYYPPPASGVVHSLYGHGGHGGNDLFYANASGGGGGGGQHQQHSGESKSTGGGTASNTNTKGLSLHDLQQHEGAAGGAGGRKMSNVGPTGLNGSQNNNANNNGNSNSGGYNHNNTNDYNNSNNHNQHNHNHHSQNQNQSQQHQQQQQDADTRSEGGSDDLEVVEIDLRY